ncbi:hypothetical protein [Kineococcus sp. SYSU DK006]|uniref:hypothetical protein n=1 Tax=Kineococcus sp. SYSU DK006 TaxID=3383127 RepID=UPI003D7D70E5
MIGEGRYLALVWSTGGYALFAALAAVHLLTASDRDAAALWAAQSLVFGAGVVSVVRSRRRGRRLLDHVPPVSTQAEERAFRERFGDPAPRPERGPGLPRGPRAAAGRVLAPVPVAAARRPAPPRPPARPPVRRTRPLVPPRVTTGALLLSLALGSLVPLAAVVSIGGGLASGGLTGGEALVLAALAAVLTWSSGGGLAVAALRARCRQHRDLRAAPRVPRQRRAGPDGGADADLDADVDADLDLDLDADFDLDLGTG